MKISSDIIRKKADLTAEKLMNLQAPAVKGEMNSPEGTKVGLYARDFGIWEWDWPQGVGLLGLSRLNDYYKDGRYLDFLKNWYEINMKKGLPSRNINTTAPLLPMTGLLRELWAQEHEELSFSWAEWLMNELPRTKEDGFQHVTSAVAGGHDVTLNDGELWVDTLFMAVLFLNKMGIKYRNEAWIQEAWYQALIHIKYLYEREAGLFYHGWSFIENSNFGKVFWCRGNSWFTCGIMELLNINRNFIPTGLKNYFIQTYKAQASALRELQDESGLWHTVLDDETSYLETSGSAGIAAGLLNGLRQGILDDSYLPCAEKAIMGICDNITEDGTVENVSAGTAMGWNKEHYKNIITAPMAYGQALALLALVEALNYFNP